MDIVFDNKYLLTFFGGSFTRVCTIKEFTIEKLNGYHSKDELKNTRFNYYKRYTIFYNSKNKDV